MKITFENRDIGYWFNPIVVVKDESGKERLFGLTEIDESGERVPWKPFAIHPKPATP